METSISWFPVSVDKKEEQGIKNKARKLKVGFLVMDYSSLSVVSEANCGTAAGMRLHNSTFLYS